MSPEFDSLESNLRANLPHLGIEQAIGFGGKGTLRMMLGHFDFFGVYIISQSGAESRQFQLYSSSVILDACHNRFGSISSRVIFRVCPGLYWPFQQTECDPPCSPLYRGGLKHGSLVL